MTCIFCEIVAGNASAHIVYENEWCIAFTPLNVEIDDHLIVIPRQHYENILDIPEDVLSQVNSFTKKICTRLQEIAGYSGFNILHASGVDAQQSVNHFHQHILPRRSGDDINAWPNLPGGRATINRL